jgi:hypothetical protein
MVNVLMKNFAIYCKWRKKDKGEVDGGLTKK